MSKGSRNARKLRRAEKFHALYGGIKASEESTLADYINGVSGVGPLAYEWADKPHRLVYDLVRKVRMCSNLSQSTTFQQKLHSLREKAQSQEKLNRSACNWFLAGKESGKAEAFYEVLELLEMSE